MRKPTLFLLGAGAALACVTVPAMAASGAGAVMPVMGKSWSGVRPGGVPRPGMQAPRPGGWNGQWNNGGHRWGPRQNGRWYASWRAPGGWNGYQRPVYGYVLPR
jgi:hypothetical protein